ncbi:MAG: glycosyltransferase family 4 protein [Alphaproteobacteria bacterium]
MTSPPRLTLVVSSLGAGGAERVLTALANAWAGKGLAVTILTLDDGQPSFYSLHPSLVRHSLGVLGASRSRVGAVVANLRRVWRLRQAIRESRPDAVLSFMDQTNVLTVLACLGLGLTVVVSEHTDPAVRFNGRLWHALTGLTYPLATAVVALTETAAAYLRTHTGRDVVSIPNPVTVTIPTAEEGTGGPPSQILAAMGRFSREKGFDILLEAFAIVAPRHPDWTLILLGDGPERRHLEADIDRLGLRERVRLPGQVSQPAGILRRSGLFVCPSRVEGFGMALCEAMACGLPVIATDTDGPKAIVRHGENGLLVPGENPGAMARALDEMMSDPALRNRLGQQATEIADRFSLERILPQWESLLLTRSDTD